MNCTAPSPIRYRSCISVRYSNSNRKGLGTRKNRKLQFKTRSICKCNKRLENTRFFKKNITTNFLPILQVSLSSAMQACSFLPSQNVLHCNYTNNNIPPWWYLCSHQKVCSLKRKKERKETYSVWSEVFFISNGDRLCPYFLGVNTTNNLNWTFTCLPDTMTVITSCIFYTWPYFGEKRQDIAKILKIVRQYDFNVCTYCINMVRNILLRSTLVR